MEDKRQEISVEELLKPRYKHIAPYPISHCYLTVGDILKYDGDSYKVGKASMAKDTVESYPHLFRKLEWWEDIKPEEMDKMPGYIKFSYSHFPGFKVRKARFDLDTSSKYFVYLDDEPIPYCPGLNWLPATEAEYNTQNSNR